MGRVTSETKKNKQRVNLEPPRPMAARLKKTECRTLTAPARGRAVKYAYQHFLCLCPMCLASKLNFNYRYIMMRNVDEVLAAP